MEGLPPIKSAVFKGCTRPSMAIGVPLEPLVLVLMPLMVITLLGFMLFKPLALVSGGLLVAAYIGMRELSRRDDQRLKQVMIRFFLSVRQSNKHFWGAISYSPRRYRKFK